MEAVGALGVGIVLGIRHAADPDHVVAIVQLVRPGGGTTRAARTALCWGLGHSLTTLALGSVIVLGGIRAPAGLEEAAKDANPCGRPCCRGCRPTAARPPRTRLQPPDDGADNDGADNDGADDDGDGSIHGAVSCSHTDQIASTSAVV
jgi:hypothetical protein